MRHWWTTRNSRGDMAANPEMLISLKHRPTVYHKQHRDPNDHTDYLDDCCRVIITCDTLSARRGRETRILFRISLLSATVLEISRFPTAIQCGCRSLYAIGVWTPLARAYCRKLQICSWNFDDI